jgi:hypothetical protein
LRNNLNEGVENMKDEENPPFQQAQDGKDFLGSFAIS